MGRPLAEYVQGAAVTHQSPLPVKRSAEGAAALHMRLTLLGDVVFGMVGRETPGLHHTHNGGALPLQYSFLH